MTFPASRQQRLEETGRQRSCFIGLARVQRTGRAVLEGQGQVDGPAVQLRHASPSAAFGTRLPCINGGVKRALTVDDVGCLTLPSHPGRTCLEHFQQFHCRLFSV